MKYEVIKRCVIKGASCDVGDVVELDTALAGELLGIGRVVPKDESKVENRAVGVTDSEEKPKKRGRPAKAKVADKE